MTSSGNRIKHKLVIRRLWVEGGKDLLGDQRLWIETTESRIETNRQGSIGCELLVPSSLAQISRVPPLSVFSLLVMEGVIGRGKAIRCHHIIQTRWRGPGHIFGIDRMAKKSFFAPTPLPPCLTLARLSFCPQHLLVLVHVQIDFASTGVGWGGEELWWFDDD